jgi:hypothetical protein
MLCVLSTDCTHLFYTASEANGLESLNMHITNLTETILSDKPVIN